MLTSKEIRQKYLEFFKFKNHTIIPSASVIPENDSTTLFNASGMQPLVPYLMGEKHPSGTRLADLQKSIRTEDIEEIGDTTHFTFFEMIGNWSLGDYFKKEQIPWIFEFWTKILGLDPKRIYVSVYEGNKEINVPRDIEAVELWKEEFRKVGITALDLENSEEEGLRDGRIFYYGDDNWWSRVGAPSNMPVGEIGGPDSEMFYDLDPELKLHLHENSEYKDEPCHVNCDCGRFVEIGNNVFMEYIRSENGFEKLPKQNVDFGGGFERVVMIMQGKPSPYETDLFANSIKKIEELSNKKYSDSGEITKSMRIIAEHLRSASFIIGDDKGVVPSNTDQGYIVRRLIRRAIRYGKQLGIEQDAWITDIAKIVIADYGDVYEELDRNKDFILKNLAKEENQFNQTIREGLKKVEKLEKVDGKEVFDLYQTYGFPLEMTIEELDKKGIKYDVEELKKEFKTELAKHQELSRTASAGKFKGGLADSSEQTTKLHTAAHLLLAGLRKVLGDHVVQKGSNITGERLRFDFAHNEKLTDEEKSQVEDLVNEQINKKLDVSFEEMSLEEAKQKGAMGVFESRYGEQVKVYSVGEGEDNFSYEICGGPHVENIGDLGKFRIKKEKSSSAGVRRIKAVLE